MKKNLKLSVKGVAALMASTLLLGGAIGGTMAWLTDETEAVTNTFTTTDIDVELVETKKDFKMVPGATIEKDPKVTVKADSVACWLFVKIEESTTLDNYISYAVADGWTELTAGSGVYYREVDATTADVTYTVLANDRVTVLNTVTKTMMNGIDDKTVVAPTLAFTAYAIQKASFETAAAAWNEISTTTTNP